MLFAVLARSGSWNILFFATAAAEPGVAIMEIPRLFAKLVVV